MHVLSKIITSIIMTSLGALRHTTSAGLLLAGSAALLVYLTYRKPLATSSGRFFSSAPAANKSLKAQQHSAEDESSIQSPERFAPLDCETEDAAEHDEEEEGHDEDSEDSEDCEHDELAQFRAVMAVIDFDKAKHTALMLRARQQPLVACTPNGNDSRCVLDCTIGPEPQCGSFNLIYVVQWSDGLKWILRIPGHGLEFDTTDVIRMDTEYRTMKYIRERTTIPIPEVFCWETDSDRVGAPFAFMSFVEGEPLCNVWYEKDKLSDGGRFEILSSIAAYMSQLHTLEFPAMGMLQFQGPQMSPTVGPIYSRKIQSHEDGWGDHLVEGPYASASEQLQGLLARIEYPSKYAQCEEPLLRMAIESIPKTLDGNGKFYLSPTDFDLQNIMVNEAGDITGFIDWDNVMTKPAAFGYARYPAWITADWDPCTYPYAYHFADRPDDVPNASRPQVLLRYRRHYAAAFAACSPKHYLPPMTTVSHILGAIRLALEDDVSRQYILVSIIDHAFGGNPPFILKDYCQSYVAGDTVDKDEVLRVAFSRMWHAEWEEAGSVDDT